MASPRVDVGGTLRVIDVMPDWKGDYWFITRDGLVGVADRSGERVEVTSLPGEGIDNALAVVEKALELSGNHGLSRHSPLQRHYRDVLCGRVHTPQKDSVWSAAGRAALSL